MNSGEAAYVWHLSAVTRFNADSGWAKTNYCKVSVISSPTGIVTKALILDEGFWAHKCVPRNMFGKSKGNAPDTNRNSLPAQEVKRSTVGPSAAPAVPEATSSISSGLSIVGKIVGEGKLAIFGHVEGEVHASTVQIGDGAQMEGDIVAEELTIGGRVKGTIHANRVKLNSTAVVEGDIYHRSY